MVWETGTANGYRDLLAKIKTVVNANGWETKRYIEGVEDDELILKASGNSGIEQIFVGIKMRHDMTKDVFNFGIYASSLFSDGAAFDDQPGKCPTQYVYLWQNGMDYVICCDADHIKVAVQVSGTTHCFYFGKLRTYCSLGHWPRQAVCFGEGTDPNGRWSSQGDGVSNFQCMRSNPKAILWTDGSWKIGGEFKVFPTQYHGALIDDGGNYLNGSHWMLPLSLLSTMGAAGDFIGCFYICGDRTASGQRFSAVAGAREWIAIQNVYRNGFRDYMAWELN